MMKPKKDPYIERGKKLGFTIVFHEGYYLSQLKPPSYGPKDKEKFWMRFMTIDALENFLKDHERRQKKGGKK